MASVSRSGVKISLGFDGTDTEAFGVVNSPVSLGGTSYKRDVLEKSEGKGALRLLGAGCLDVQDVGREKRGICELSNGKYSAPDLNGVKERSAPRGTMRTKMMSASGRNMEHVAECGVSR